MSRLLKLLMTGLVMMLMLATAAAPAHATTDAAQSAARWIAANLVAEETLDYAPSSADALLALAAAQDPTSKMAAAQRKKLLAAADYITAALPVVLVATDAPVSLSTASDALPLAARDPQRVADLAGKYGVTNSIARLQKALDKL